MLIIYLTQLQSSLRLLFYEHMDSLDMWIVNGTYDFCLINVDEYVMSFEHGIEYVIWICEF